MSPGWSVSTGNFSRMARTARGRVRLNTGMARGEWASELPRASRISQAKSCASPMISENAVRHTVSQHSSTRLMSRLHMISSPMGSASMRATASRSEARSGAPGPGRCALADLDAEVAAGHRPSTRSPGGITVVDSRSSTMAGPAMACPGARA